jgi:hypothetical protein
MSLETTLTSCVQRIATEFQAVYAGTGSLINLATTNKTNLVNAINEVLSRIGSTQTDLSAELTTRLAALKAEILGGADAAFDTLKELQTYLETNASEISALLTAIGNRVRYDAAQTLTVEQKAQARANIGAVSATEIGDISFDCVAVFEAALAA